MANAFGPYNYKRNSGLDLATAIAKGASNFVTAYQNTMNARAMQQQKSALIELQKQKLMMEMEKAKQDIEPVAIDIGKINTLMNAKKNGIDVPSSVEKNVWEGMMEKLDNPMKMDFAKKGIDRLSLGASTGNPAEGISVPSASEYGANQPSQGGPVYLNKAEREIFGSMVKGDLAAELARLRGEYTLNNTAMVQDYAQQRQDKQIAYNQGRDASNNEFRLKLQDLVNKGMLDKTIADGIMRINNTKEKSQGIYQNQELKGSQKMDQIRAQGQNQMRVQGLRNEGAIARQKEANKRPLGARGANADPLLKGALDSYKEILKQRGQIEKPNGIIPKTETEKSRLRSQNDQQLSQIISQIEGISGRKFNPAAFGVDAPPGGTQSGASQAAGGPTKKASAPSSGLGGPIPVINDLSQAKSMPIGSPFVFKGMKVYKTQSGNFEEVK